MSGREAFRQLAVAVAAFGLLFALTAKLTPERPSIPRQYPRSGLVAELGGMEENKVCMFDSATYNGPNLIL